jgi:hypothetical protein
MGRNLDQSGSGIKIPDHIYESLVTTVLFGLNLKIVVGGKSGKHPGRNLPPAQCKIYAMVLL